MKKNVIVLKNGKNVFPEEIEVLISNLPYVTENFVFGKPRREDDEKDLALWAKIVYDPAYMKEHYGASTPEEAEAVISKDIDAINATMPAYKQVYKLIVTDHEMIKTTTGKVKRYVVDFPGDEVLGVDNIVAIPHLGASSEESEDNCAVMAADELMEYIENGNIVNSVNLPNLSMAKTGDAKICIIHRNVEGLLTKVTACAANGGINIENMESKSRKDYAYTVLDVIGNADAVVDAIKAVENVIAVRVIK